MSVNLRAAPESIWQHLRRSVRGHVPDASAVAGVAYADRSDPDLIQACLAGEDAAWTALVERYGRLVYSIPFRWGLSSADADDVFQNVFAIVFNRLSGLRNRDCLSAWLITTTSRECWRISKLARSRTDVEESVPDEGILAPDRVQHWERQHLLHEAIRRLDPRSQQLLQLLFFDPDTPNYEEIATRLGLAVGSIGSARARSLKKLEAILVEMGINHTT